MKTTKYFILGKVTQNVPDGVSVYEPFYKKEYKDGEVWFPHGVATIQISNRAGTIKASYEINSQDRGMETIYLENGDSIQKFYMVVEYAPVSFIPKKATLATRLLNLLIGNPSQPTWPIVDDVIPSCIKYQKLDNYSPAISG